MLVKDFALRVHSSPAGVPFIPPTVFSRKFSDAQQNVPKIQAVSDDCSAGILRYT